MISTFPLNTLLCFKLAVFSFIYLLSFELFATEAKTALVIGNSNYADAPLANPVNDAIDLSTTLKQLGFEVILTTDANQQAMEESVADFGSLLQKKGGIGLFFYAGHGIQSEGQNYLIPSTAGSNRDGTQKISKEVDLRYKAVNLSYVIDEMESSTNTLNIVILDACRNNPLTRSFRSSSRGLARITNTTKNLLLAYSTAPGEVAADGYGKNSPYTSALIKAIQKPNQHVLLAFQDVASEVQQNTKGKQIPWTSSSLTSDFYFSSSKEGITALAPQANLGLSPQNAAVNNNTVKPRANKTNNEQTIAIRTGNQTKVDPSSWESFQDPLSSGGLGPTMVVVSGDDFLMGSSGEYATEEPQHPVSIDYQFAIAKYELRNAEYTKYLAHKGLKVSFRSQEPDKPTTNISWQELQAYSTWLSEETGHTYRLPTETEWEFAARGGNGSKYYWGDDIWTCAKIMATDFDRLRQMGSNKLKQCASALQADIQANCKHCLAWVEEDHAFPVSAFKPNPFGLHNTLGNVAEIVMDCWKPNYYGAPSDGSARLSGKCKKITVRGGHWNSGFDTVTSASRSPLSKKGKSKYVGARLVRELD